MRRIPQQRRALRSREAFASGESARRIVASVQRESEPTGGTPDIQPRSICMNPKHRIWVIIGGSASFVAMVLTNAFKAAELQPSFVVVASVVLAAVVGGIVCLELLADPGPNDRPMRPTADQISPLTAVAAAGGAA